MLLSHFREVISRGVHRSAAEGASTRRRKKLLAKSSWFRTPPRTDNDLGPKRSKSEPNKPRVEPVSVIFVPQTRFGALASKLKQDEVALTQITGEKLKVTERSGTTVEQLLISSNPWQAGDCGRDSCLVCRHGDGKQVCGKRSCLYETFCIPCKDKFEEFSKSKPKPEDDGGDETNEAAEVSQEVLKLPIYTGESKMTPMERSRNHYDDYRLGLASSHMYKHFMNRHRQEKKRPEFKMVAVKFFKSAFIRQLSEAVRLRRRTQQPHIEVMNSRGEYSRTHLPRLVVESQDNPDLDNENGKKQNVGKVTHEFGSNTKSVDSIPKDDDMPQRVKSLKLKTDRQSANKITQHFKPVT